MSTTLKIANSQPQTLYKIVSLLTFLLATALGIVLPIIAIPWMFFLAYLGLDYRKELKGSFMWQVDHAFMAAAIVLGVAIFVVLGFVFPWTSKPLI